MSTQTPFDSDDYDEQLAGDYVLGTLSLAEREKAEQRMRNDAAFQRLVVAWEMRLTGLNDLTTPVEPSAHLWQRIEHSLSPARGASTPGARRASLAERLRGSWNSVRLWRSLALVTTTAMVLVSVLTVRQTMAPTTVKYMVVLVAPQDKTPGWVVQASSSNALQLISLSPTPVPQQKTYQFWTKGEGWKGPVSLGLVRPGQPLTVPVEALPPLQPNQLFEITLEPPAGSPTGKPTGPILYIGRAVKVT